MYPTAYNDTNFRLQFPAFADATQYSTQQLSGWWTMGTSFLNSSNVDPFSQVQLQLAQDLMAAHLAQSYSLINQGISTALVQSTSEGSVSVSMTPPPVSSAFGYWLSTTSYGQQLRAMLKMLFAGGFYVGALPERAAFRKVGGIF